ARHGPFRDVYRRKTGGSLATRRHIDGSWFAHVQRLMGALPIVIKTQFSKRDPSGLQIGLVKKLVTLLLERPVEPLHLPPGLRVTWPAMGRSHTKPPEACLQLRRAFSTCIVEGIITQQAVGKSILSKGIPKETPNELRGLVPQWFQNQAEAGTIIDQ